MDILELKNISKKFENFVLEHVSFKVSAGSILSYIGPNGSGKTTTIKIITDQYKSDSGEVTINGKKLSKAEAYYKNSIGYVSDNFYFPDFLKVRDVRNILADFYDSFDVNKFQYFVELWKLPYKQRLGTFSRGMKARLMFACVLSREPLLLIIDEATNGLDPVARVNILHILKEYVRDQNKSILFSTHIMSEVEEISDHVYFINNGGYVDSGALDNVLNKYLIVESGVENIEFYKKSCIGYAIEEKNIKGLIYTNQKEEFSVNSNFSRASIEDIVFFRSETHLKNNQDGGTIK